MLRALFFAAVSVLAVVIFPYDSLRAVAQIAPGVTQSAAQTATISGTVVGPDATPVASASLRLDGPNAHLTTVSDTHGTFIFTSVPYGTYSMYVTAVNVGIATRSGIVVKGDISVAIQYAAPASGLREIARVSTSSSGAQINVTPASIASVRPSDYAFQGNLSWRELLNQIPGVSVGGGEGGGDANAGALMIPNSPFQPVILSINGALPYETSTTFDGMPLSNSTLASAPGNGVDLSPFPLALFETADIVRGPGANAPSIVDSVGGSLVLHAPGEVEKNSFEASVSSDAYGGYNGTSKFTYRAGKLSATLVYGFNNSPGPWGNRPGFAAISSVATINGSPVASGGLVQYYPSQYVACAFSFAQTTLMTKNFPQSTEWRQHDGGIGLAYQLTPRITVQAFYTGSQTSGIEPSGQLTFNFTPDSGYTGPLSAGLYQTGAAGGGNLPLSQAGSLLEEKVTAYLGRGVLRLAALQSSTYAFQLGNNVPSGTYPLYGTASYCANPLCTSTTPVAFNGSPAALTFSPGSFLCDIWSHDNDFLASYEMQLGSRSNAGISYVKSGVSGTTSLSFTGFNLLTTGNFTTNEFRLYASTELSEKLSLDASYYLTQADYHVPLRAGLHSALVQLNGSRGRIVARSMITIAAAARLDAANYYSTKQTILIPRPGYTVTFVDVPKGTDALIVQADRDLPFRLLIQDSSGNPYIPNSSAHHSMTIPNPMAGTLAILLLDSHDVDTTTRDLLAVEPTAATVRIQAVRVDRDPSHEAASTFAKVPVREVGSVQTLLSRNGQFQSVDPVLIPIEVPSNTDALMIDASGTDSWVDVYLLDCRQKTCSPFGRVLGSGSDKRLTIPNVPPGRYDLALDDYDPMQPGAGLPNYRVSVFAYNRFGAVGESSASAAGHAYEVNCEPPGNEVVAAPKCGLFFTGP